MDQEKTTRRRLLRAGIGAGALTTVAGCSSIPGLGGGADDGDTADGGSYADWIPSPAALSGASHHEYTLLGVESLLANRDHLDEGVYAENQQFFSNLLGRLGASLESARDHVSIGSEALIGDGPRVITGSFDTESIRTALTDSGYQRSGSNGDYVTFAGGSSAAYPAVAVGPDGIVLSGGTAASARTVVESKRGSNRYAANPDFEALVSQLGRGFIVSGGTNRRFENERIRPSEPQFVGQVAAGASLSIAGATTNVEYVFVFDTADVADPDPVREWLNLERTEGLVAPFTPGSVERDGRVVSATGSTETGSLLTN